MAVFAGTPGNDSLVGGTGNDTLNGLAGDDTLVGGAGADLIDGGDDSDRLYSFADPGYYQVPFFTNPWQAPVMDVGAERDTLAGGSGDDIFFAGYGDNVDGGTSWYYGNNLYISLKGATSGVHADFSGLSQGAITLGGATIQGIQGVQWIEGSDYGDYLKGYSYGNYYDAPIFGGGGNDTIIGTHYSGQLIGGDGDDLIDNIEGGLGRDLHGGAGDDTIFGGASSLIEGGSGNDELRGGPTGSTLILGGEGNDLLIGDEGMVVPSYYYQYFDDTLKGGAGDDTLTGGRGSDYIFGSDGTDVVTFDRDLFTYHLSYDSASQLVSVSDSDTELGGVDRVSGVEVFRFADGDQSSAQIAAMFGTSGNDTFNGTSDGDSFDGVGGNDTINGAGGDDKLAGGPGNDVLDGGTGIDTLSFYSAIGGVSIDLSLTTPQSTPGDGTETVSNFENIEGSRYDDSLTGNQLSNRIDGLRGDDTLDGGAGGIDTLAGGAGSDLFIVHSADDVVIELPGEGTDSVESALTFTLPDNVESLRLTGDTDIDAHGNELANYLTGNAGANYLEGGAGNDRLYSAVDPGNWSLYPGKGGQASAPMMDVLAVPDTLSGGDGDDTIFAGYGDEVDGGISTYYSDNRLYISFQGASAGVNADFSGLAQGGVTIGGATIQNIQSVQWIDGSDYGDYIKSYSGLYGNPGPIHGGGGDDTIIGTGYGGQLFGGDGNDLIDNGASYNDTPLHGDAGNDTIIGGQSRTLDGGDGDDSLTGLNGTGGAGNDTLVATGPYYGGRFDGGTGNDSIVGGDAGTDTLHGGTGDDTLKGQGGNDSIDGSDGFDIAVYAGDFADYQFTYDSVWHVMVVSDSAAVRDGVDTLSRVELFRFADGDRTIESIAAMFGTGGADVFNGTDADESFDGLGGNDTIFGAGGNDTFTGGLGNDLLDGGPGIDTLSYVSALSGVAIDLSITAPQATFASGFDTVSNFENLIGGKYNDKLTGNASSNHVGGGAGDDTLDGGAGGTDTLVGGKGNDLFIVQSSGDAVIELANEGDDTVESSATFTLPDNVELLHLTGAGNVDAYGNALDNRLVGNDGMNILYGGSGNDHLDAAGGDDSIDGGSGYDLAVGGAGNDSIDGGADYDTLVGGDGADFLAGGDDGDWIYSAGSDGSDSLLQRLDRGTESDTLLGGGGGDILFAGAGDWVDGGGSASYDRDELWISFAGVQQGVHADFRELANHGSTQVAGATIADIENMRVIEGSAFDDFIAGYAPYGSETIMGGGGNDHIIADGGTQFVSGDAGNDLIDCTASYYGPDVAGGAGNDTIIGSRTTGIAVFTGGVDQYLIRYDTATATFTVTDLIANRDGVDAVQGLQYARFGGVVYELANQVTFTGTGGNDNVTGDSLNNTLYGLAGNDSLSGLAGDDTLIGGAGSDTLNGGDGIDTASYRDQTTGVKVTLTNSKAQATGLAGKDVLVNIENLAGGSGADTLTGSNADNLLSGDAGNDLLDGGKGADTLLGGAGNDTYVVDATDYVYEDFDLGVDTVQASFTYTLPMHIENLLLTGKAQINGYGNWGDNQIVGNVAGNHLDGQSGNDTLDGGASNDTLNGGWDDDVLIGGLGADSMDGGYGNDTYYVDNTAGVVYEDYNYPWDVDTVHSTITYELPSNFEQLILDGKAKINGTGNDQSNLLVGNGAANILIGGFGDDTLDGGLGVDTLTGGAGYDQFRFTTALKSNIDRVTDFEAGIDKFVLDHAIFKVLAQGGFDPSAFQADATSVATSSSVHVIFNTATGALLYDADGSGKGAAVQFATVALTGLVGTITADDFLVI